MNKQQIDPAIEQGWKEILQNEFQSDYFRQLKDFLLSEKKIHAIYPPGDQIFNAFNFTPFREVRVVILGQDPYHGPGQAHGLCFSVPHGIPPPPSLINIFKELESDIGVRPIAGGNLEKWARQGVLLLNATLTVRAHQAGSHQKKGWEAFTDAAIKNLSDHKDGVVFLLWGNYAISKKTLINTQKHFVFTAPHPSPLSASRGFFGCRHFSKTNQILEERGQKAIDWQLND